METKIKHAELYIQKLEAIKGFDTVYKEWVSEGFTGRYVSKDITALKNEDSIINIHREINLPELFKTTWFHAPNHIPVGGIFELSTYINNCKRTLNEFMHNYYDSLV